MPPPPSVRQCGVRVCQRTRADSGIKRALDGGPGRPDAIVHVFGVEADRIERLMKLRDVDHVVKEDCRARQSNDMHLGLLDVCLQGVRICAKGLDEDRVERSAARWGLASWRHHGGIMAASQRIKDARQTGAVNGSATVAVAPLTARNLAEDSTSVVRLLAGHCHTAVLSGTWSAGAVGLSAVMAVCAPARLCVWTAAPHARRAAAGSGRPRASTVAKSVACRRNAFGFWTGSIVNTPPLGAQMCSSLRSDVISASAAVRASGKSRMARICEEELVDVESSSSVVNESGCASASWNSWITLPALGAAMTMTLWPALMAPRTC
eukprot:m.43009 g.43009  ORF g.43009 m.43009 type:complete len:322 (-) comp5754_c0_seq2:52-1017(-)